MTDKIIDTAINKILDFELDESHYSELPREFWKNEEFIMTCLENDHHTTEVFNYVDKSMWLNKKFILRLLDFNKDKEEWRIEEVMDNIDSKLKIDKDIIKYIKR